MGFNSAFKLINRRKIYFLVASLIFLAFFLIGLKFPNYFIHLQKYLASNNSYSGIGLFLFLLLNNTTIAFLGFMSGILFGLIPFLLLAINGYMIGIIFSHAYNISSVYEVIVKLFPHGLFEIPAILLTMGYGLSSLNLLKGSRNSLKKRINDYYSQGAELFILIIIPLFFIAAIIETILISNMSFVLSYMMNSSVNLYFESLLFSFVLYGSIKLLLTYLKTTDIRYLFFMGTFFLIGSKIWLVIFGENDLIEPFNILIIIIPFILLFVYLESLINKRQKPVISVVFRQYAFPLFSKLMSLKSLLLSLFFSSKGFKKKVFLGKTLCIIAFFLNNLIFVLPTNLSSIKNFPYNFIVASSTFIVLLLLTYVIVSLINSRFINFSAFFFEINFFMMCALLFVALPAFFLTHGLVSYFSRLETLERVIFTFIPYYIFVQFGWIVEQSVKSNKFRGVATGAVSIAMIILYYSILLHIMI